MDFFDAAENNKASPPHEEPENTISYAGELNEEQYHAVTAPSGPSLVLAGAGSGKTRTLTYRVAWLLEQGIAPDAILLLTFTNKAAREMLERVEDLTGVSSRIFWGGTFHHIGQRLLRRYGRAVGVEPGFTIMDQGDAEALLADVIRDTEPAYLKNKNNPKAKVLANLISYARNTLGDLGTVTAERCPFPEDLPRSIDKFAKVYQKTKLEKQILDYDDLLVLWLELLKTDASFADFCNSRFQEILVDEYQDTNRLQAEIVDRMAKHHRIMAVGDDAQCIYTWRGAEFDNIITFPDRHPDTVIHKIETNYRSTPQILTFANGILAGDISAVGYEKILRPVRSDGDTPCFVTTSDGRNQADFIIQTISQLREQGRAYSDIAILYRAHYHAMDLQTELSRVGIPFEITSGLRFFEQAHIKDVVSQVRFVANPRDTTAFLRFACLLPKIGPKTAQKIYMYTTKKAEKEKKDFFSLLTEPDVMKKVPADAREDWESLALTLQDARKAIWEEATPATIMRLVVEGWYGTYLRTLFPNWRNREDDLEGLIGFAARYDDLSELLSQLILLNSETSDRTIDRREDNVRLTTIHQSKGLEFPVVFVIGLADGMFPLTRAIEEDNLEEERRLFYVSVTRAQEVLFLSYPSILTQGGPPRRTEPSRFINSIHPDHYRNIRFRAIRGW